MMRLVTANRKVEEIEAFKDQLSDLVDNIENLVDNTTPTFTLPLIILSEKSK